MKHNPFMNTLAILRRQSPEYQEYKRLRSYINYQTRRLNTIGLSERASYTYYINIDKLKQLKAILKQKHLID